MFCISLGLHYLCRQKAKSMRKVIGIGETVLDIIFRNEQPISAVPGGSTFNAIISLGRSGVETGFISETGSSTSRTMRNIYSTKIIPTIASTSTIQRYSPMIWCFSVPIIR